MTATSSEVVTVTTDDGVSLYLETTTAASSTEEKDSTIVHNILFVHGWLNSRRFWDRNVQEIASRAPKSRCICYDQRYHGKSSSSSSASSSSLPSIPLLANDLKQVIEFLKLDKNNNDTSWLTLIGSSMGCNVIWSYINENYLVLSEMNNVKLVFIDQSPYMFKAIDWNHYNKGIHDEAGIKWLQNFLQDDKLQTFTDLNVKSSSAIPLPNDILNMLEGETQKCLPALTQLGLLFEDLVKRDYRMILPQISYPVLNMAGGAEKCYTKESVYKVGSLVQDGVNITHPDAGHWLYLEDPVWFNERIVRFVLKGQRY